MNRGATRATPSVWSRAMHAPASSTSSTTSLRQLRCLTCLLTRTSRYLSIDAWSLRRSRPSSALKEPKCGPSSPHHTVLPGQPYNSLIDGLPHCPEHLGDIACSFLLTSVELVLQTAVARTRSLPLTVEQAAEFARVRFDVEDSATALDCDPAS